MDRLIPGTVELVRDEHGTRVIWHWSVFPFNHRTVAETRLLAVNAERARSLGPSSR